MPTRSLGSLRSSLASLHRAQLPLLPVTFGREEGAESGGGRGLPGDPQSVAVPKGRTADWALVPPAGSGTAPLPPPYLPWAPHIPAVSCGDLAQEAAGAQGKVSWVEFPLHFLGIQPDPQP